MSRFSPVRTFVVAAVALAVVAMGSFVPGSALACDSCSDSGGSDSGTPDSSGAGGGGDTSRGDSNQSPSGFGPSTIVIPGLSSGAARADRSQESATRDVVNRVKGVQPTFALTEVKSEGEFYILTEDGRKLIGQNAAQVPLSSKAKVITGLNGRVEMRFPDGTTFAVGPDSHVVLDEFIYDPSTGVRRIAAQLTKGLFRWVTGLVVDRKAEIERFNLKVGRYIVGIRGTDFETAFFQDGSKFVKVFSGEVVLTPENGRPSVVIVAGRMISISSANVIAGPSAIQ